MEKNRFKHIFWENVWSIWGDESLGGIRHWATAGLVVFARGPELQVPHLQPFCTCILGSHNLDRTNPGCQRVGRKDRGRERKCRENGKRY